LSGARVGFGLKLLVILTQLLRINFPGAKAFHYLGIFGTPEAVPFQNKFTSWLLVESGGKVRRISAPRPAAYLK
jgi:hypothetical protein